MRFAFYGRVSTDDAQDPSLSIPRQLAACKGAIQPAGGSVVSHYPGRMAQLEGDRRDWNELATLDPYWAVWSRPERRFGRWTREEFLASGQREVDKLLERLEALEHPVKRHSVLDFGCGLGRLAPALAAEFGEYVGVDISDGMVDQARRLHGDLANCRFVVNARDDLRLFEDRSFDVVYSRIVLQHVSDRAAILSYVAEFVRVLRDGGVAFFELPSFIPRRYRLQPQRRAYAALRRLGVPPDVRHRRLRVQPIRMNAVPEEQVTGRLELSGARVLEAESRRSGQGLRLTSYLATRP